LFAEYLLPAFQFSIHDILILIYFQIIYLCQDLQGKSRNLYIAQLGCWKSDSEFSAVDFSVLSFTCSYMLVQNCCSVSEMNAAGDLQEVLRLES